MSVTIGTTTTGHDELGSPWIEHSTSQHPTARYRAQFNPYLVCWQLSFHTRESGVSHDWFIPGVIQAFNDGPGKERLMDWLRETFTEVSEQYSPCAGSCFTCVALSDGSESRGAKYDR